MEDLLNVSQYVEPDTQMPGMTKNIPQEDSSRIGLNPLGLYTPPTSDAGEFDFQELVITVNPRKIGLPSHAHIMLDNQGLVTIQLSKNAAQWFNVMPSGRAFVLDFHRDPFIWAQTAAGVAVLLITTW